MVREGEVGETEIGAGDSRKEEKEGSTDNVVEVTREEKVEEYRKLMEGEVRETEIGAPWRPLPTVRRRRQQPLLTVRRRQVRRRSGDTPRHPQLPLPRTPPTDRPRHRTLERVRSGAGSH